MEGTRYTRGTVASLALIFPPVLACPVGACLESRHCVVLWCQIILASSRRRDLPLHHSSWAQLLRAPSAISVLPGASWFFRELET